MLTCEMASQFRAKYMCEDEMPNKGWKLIAVDPKNNTFLIKNFKYDEYLYATNVYLGLFTKGRPIYTAMLPKTDNIDEYVWYFEEVSNKLGYKIWNVKYNERKGLIILIILFSEFKIFFFI